MRFLAFVVLTLATTTPSSAQDMPPRKPGLWRVTMTMPGGRPGPGEMRMCIDSKSDAALMKMGAGAAQGRCTKNESRRSGNQMIIDSVCTIGSSVSTSHIVMTMTGDNAYHTDIVSRTEPPLAGQAETHITQDGTWTGACPADMQPGDMMMPNGMKVNMLTMGGKP
jgi:hypothetical protein